jgi:excisionase family DNA binding protein
MGSRYKKRIGMDDKLAEVIREHYRCTIPTEKLVRSCFSDPQLKSHVCNKLELLDGGKECTYCGHDPNKICVYSCHVSQACLAAFAHRLGIGGDDPIKAVKKNLKLSYQELLDQINAKLNPSSESEELTTSEDPMPESKVTSEEPKTACKDCSSCSGCATTCESEKPVEVPSDDSEHTGEEDTLFTVKEAAEYLGCTSPNIYAKISRGKIDRQFKPGDKKTYVSKLQIDGYKKSTKKRKG